MAAAHEDLRTEGSRKNGWSLPLHLLQVGGWVAVLYFMLVYFSTFVPALPTNWQPAAYIINGLIGLAIMVTLLVATTINPADPAVLAKGTGKTVARLDRSKHPHAIQNQHCYLCEVNVGPKSKHCRACNKCVSDFDHHCKWLNNCVGGRNYRWFLCSLVTGAIGTLLVLIVGLLEFICYFVDKEDKQILQPYIVLREEQRGNDSAQFEIIHQSVSDEGWLSLTGITVLLAAVTLVLLAHLLFFHLWLMYKGLTTYEYIVMLREKEGYQDSEAQKQSSSSSAPRPQTFKDLREKTSAKSANKVTPSKSGPAAVDGRGSHSKHDRSQEQYEQALRHLDQADGGETPPPLSSPLHLGGDEVIETTAVRKLKKKKKKSSSASGEQNIATVGENTLYSYGSKEDNHTQTVPVPGKHTKGKTKSSKQDRVQTQKETSLSDSDESLKELPATKPKSKKSRSKGTLGDSDGETDLNSTMMFTLNSSAKLLPDGSLDYSDRDAFNHLPLTPVLFRRQPDIPPLDLTALRTSNDSAMSFQPYSATVRSTDTYRPGERVLPKPLKSVPEGTLDLTV